MRRIISFTASAVITISALLACNYPPPDPPRQTATATATFVPIGSGAGTPGRPPTNTPLPPIDVTLPATAATRVATAAATHTLPPTPTQFTIPQTSTVNAPLTITNIALVGVERDPSRPNGAIAKIKIEFTGGLPPYTFYDENIKQKGNPVEALTDCSATLVHTAHVESADGQRASQSYYFSPINCP